MEEGAWNVTGRRSMWESRAMKGAVKGGVGGMLWNWMGHCQI